MKSLDSVKDFQKTDSFETLLSVLHQISHHVDTLRNDITILSTPVSNFKDSSQGQLPDDNVKPLPAPPAEDEKPKVNESMRDNNTKGKTLKPPKRPSPTTPTPRPGLPVDIVTNRRRNPPRLPIAHPGTTTPPMRTTTPTPATRFVWNATITRFRDPDNRDAMLWGLVVTLSIAVFGLSVGITCYCYWKRGPRAHVTTRIQRAAAQARAAATKTRPQTKTVQKPMEVEEGLEDIPLDETEFGNDSDIENVGAVGGLGLSC